MKIKEIQNSKTTEKIKEIKSFFFEINKIVKLLAGLIREREKKDTHDQYLKCEKQHYYRFYSKGK